MILAGKYKEARKKRAEKKKTMPAAVPVADAVSVVYAVAQSVVQVVAQSDQHDIQTEFHNAPHKRSSKVAMLQPITELCLKDVPIIKRQRIRMIPPQA